MKTLTIRIYTYQKRKKKKTIGISPLCDCCPSATHMCTINPLASEKAPKKISLYTGLNLRLDS